MSRLRAAVAGLLLLQLLALVAPYGAQPPARVVAVARVTTTTTAPSTTTSTTSPPAPPIRPVRASRGASRRSVPLSADYQAQAIAVICAYAWPCGQAVKVASCESGLRADAYNPRSGATGVFQILHGPSDLDANVAVAYGMWQRRGWQPWAASRRCSGVA